MSDLALFLRQFVRSPRQVSALAPSSQALARAMAAEVGPGTGPVVEFGPGTGRITEAILARGVAPANLTLIEMNPDFAEALVPRFPGVTLHVTGAQNVARHVPRTVGAVLSGLPLLSMPQPLRHAIVSAAFDVLRPDGRFVQFTYGARPPLPDDMMRDMGLQASEAGPRIWANLPPAQVYVLRRLPQSRAAG
jgi:phosphatidylethanolamine/phosphatidyl-N-methylethanolamine N-methyltransferase